MGLSLEKWRKLSEKEKGIRYKELSDHDKFLVRISSPIIGETISYEPLTVEEEEEAKKEFDEILKHFKVIK